MPGHAERRAVPYAADDMFGLVADVGAYSEFLPWCAASRVIRRTPRAEGGELIEAELVIAFRVFRESFLSRVTLNPRARRIDVEYLDGPFRWLENHWHFRPLDSGGCEVDFRVDFEFRSALLERLVGAVFHRAMVKVVAGFEARAEALYGSEARSAGSDQELRS